MKSKCKSSFMLLQHLKKVNQTRPKSLRVRAPSDGNVSFFFSGGKQFKV